MGKQWKSFKNQCLQINTVLPGKHLFCYFLHIWKIGKWGDLPFLPKTPKTPISIFSLRGRKCENEVFWGKGKNDQKWGIWEKGQKWAFWEKGGKWENGRIPKMAYFEVYPEKGKNGVFWGYP